MGKFIIEVLLLVAFVIGFVYVVYIVFFGKQTKEQAKDSNNKLEELDNEVDTINNRYKEVSRDVNNIDNKVKRIKNKLK